MGGGTGTWSSPEWIAGLQNSLGPWLSNNFNQRQGSYPGQLSAPVSNNPWLQLVGGGLTGMLYGGQPSGLVASQNALSQFLGMPSYNAYGTTPTYYNYNYPTYNPYQIPGYTGTGGGTGGGGTGGGGTGGGGDDGGGRVPGGVRPGGGTGGGTNEGNNYAPGGRGASSTGFDLGSYLNDLFFNNVAPGGSRYDSGWTRGAYNNQPGPPWYVDATQQGPMRYSDYLIRPFANRGESVGDSPGRFGGMPNQGGLANTQAAGQSGGQGYDETSYLRDRMANNATYGFPQGQNNNTSLPPIEFGANGMPVMLPGENTGAYFARIQQYGFNPGGDPAANAAARQYWSNQQNGGGLSNRGAAGQSGGPGTADPRFSPGGSAGGGNTTNNWQNELRAYYDQHGGGGPIPTSPPGNMQEIHNWYVQNYGNQNGTGDTTTTTTTTFDNWNQGYTLPTQFGGSDYTGQSSWFGNIPGMAAQNQVNAQNFMQQYLNQIPGALQQNLGLGQDWFNNVAGQAPGTINQGLAQGSDWLNNWTSGINDIMQGGAGQGNNWLNNWTSGINDIMGGGAAQGNNWLQNFAGNIPGMAQNAQENAANWMTNWTNPAQGYLSNAMSGASDILAQYMQQGSGQIPHTAANAFEAMLTTKGWNDQNIGNAQNAYNQLYGQAGATGQMPHTAANAFEAMLTTKGWNDAPITQAQSALAGLQGSSPGIWGGVQGNLNDIMATGAPVNVTPQWQQMTGAMDINTQHNLANAAEAYSMGNKRFGSGAANQFGNVASEAAAQQNSLLGQMTQQALEAAANRRLTATGQGAQLGQMQAMLPIQQAEALLSSGVQDRGSWANLLSSASNAANQYGRLGLDAAQQGFGNQLAAAQGMLGSGVADRESWANLLSSAAGAAGQYGRLGLDQGNQNASAMLNAAGMLGNLGINAAQTTGNLGIQGANTIGDIGAQYGNMLGNLGIGGANYFQGQGMDIANLMSNLGLGGANYYQNQGMDIAGLMSNLGLGGANYYGNTGINAGQALGNLGLGGANMYNGLGMDLASLFSNIGLQGMSTMGSQGNDLAQILGNLGLNATQQQSQNAQQQWQNQMNILNSLSGYGGQMQGLGQDALNRIYADYQNSQQMPFLPYASQLAGLSQLGYNQSQLPGIIGGIGSLLGGLGDSGILSWLGRLFGIGGNNGGGTGGGTGGGGNGIPTNPDGSINWGDIIGGDWGGPGWNPNQGDIPWWIPGAGGYDTGGGGGWTW